MPIYDGIVNLAEDDIPVVIELDAGHVRLSASGREIGDWPSDECQIIHLEDTTYTISAENETLRFVPSQPRLFAAAIDGGKRELETPSSESEAQPEPLSPSKPEWDDGQDITEAPPPRPVTVALFYALCALTAAMGIWALIRMVL